MPGLFVTATGTDAGKTFVTAGLIRAARRTGRVVRALKPVVSGFEAGHPEGSDPAVLLEALGVPRTAGTIAEVSPFRFVAPLSPDMAAAREGRALGLDEVVSACRLVLGAGHFTLIEGVGGIMVPLGPGVTMLDVMSALALPAVLVSPTGLGAISHLLTALDVLDRRGLTPSCVVFSETPGSTVSLEATIDTVSGFYARSNIVSLRRTLRLCETTAAFDHLFAHIERGITSRGD